jgi:hypothetical protein
MVNVKMVLALVWLMRELPSPSPFTEHELAAGTEIAVNAPLML